MRRCRAPQNGVLWNDAAVVLSASMSIASTLLTSACGTSSRTRHSLASLAGDNLSASATRSSAHSNNQRNLHLTQG